MSVVFCILPHSNIDVFWVDNLRSHRKSTRFPCANHVVRGLEFLQLSGSLLIVWLLFRCLQHWRECRELLFGGAVATPLSSPWVPWLVLVQWQVWLPAGVAGRRAGKNCTWVFGRIGRQVARIAMSRTTGLHDEI